MNSTLKGYTRNLVIICNETHLKKKKTGNNVLILILNLGQISPKLKHTFPIMHIFQTPSIPADFSANVCHKIVLIPIPQLPSFSKFKEQFVFREMHLFTLSASGCFVPVSVIYAKLSKPASYLLCRQESGVYPLT